LLDLSRRDIFFEREDRETDFLIGEDVQAENEDIDADDPVREGTDFGDMASDGCSVFGDSAVPGFINAGLGICNGEG